MSSARWIRTLIEGCFVGYNSSDLQKNKFLNRNVRNSHTNQCLQYLTSVDYSNFAQYDCVSNGNEKFEIILNPISFPLVLPSVLASVLPTDSPPNGAPPIGITFKLSNISRDLYIYYDYYGDTYGISNTSGKAHQFQYNYKTGEFKAMEGNKNGQCLQQGGSGLSQKAVFAGCNGGNL